MTLKMKKQLAPVRPDINGYGHGNKKLYLTIHQTGNTTKGANAEMHAKLQAGVYGSSWHWQVDDHEAIQSFEHTYSCWHASDGRGPGNLNSIAIEGCINSDGNYVQSVKNMAELAAILLKQEGIPITNMKQHHDWDTVNHKNCPAQIRAGKDGIDWNKFVSMVQENLNQLNGADDGMTKPGKEIMRCINYLSIYEKPTTKSKVINTKQKDSNVTVDGYVYGEAVYKENIWWFKVEGGFAFSGDFLPKIDQLFLDKNNSL